MASHYSNSQIKELLQTDRAKSLHVSLSAKIATLPDASIPLYQGAGKSYTPELIGTGFPLEIGPRKMLVTAGHVTDLLSSKYFYVPQDGQLQPLDCKISRFGHADVPRAEDPIDVSIIHLTDDQTKRLAGYRFVQLAEMEYERVLHDPQGYNAFIGYPASKNKGKLKAQAVRPDGYPYIGVQIPISEHEKVKRPHETHLGIEFEKRGIGFDGNAITLPDLYGISGCPVWYLGRRAGQITSDNGLTNSDRHIDPENREGVSGLLHRVDCPPLGQSPPNQPEIASMVPRWMPTSSAQPASTMP